MSSDSGESHSSAHHDHGDGIESRLAGREEAVEENATRDDVAAEAAGDELESTGSGSDGLTFARTRRSFPQQFEDETASEVSARPRLERPASPESTSTPDDTPSILVCDQSDIASFPLTMEGLWPVLAGKQHTRLT